MMRSTVVSQGTFLHLDVPTLFGAAAEAGFDAINIWRHAPVHAEAGAIRSAMDASGVGVDAVCRGGWIAGERSEDIAAESLRALDDAAALGARQLVIVVPPLRGRHAAPPAESMRQLERLLPAAAERDVALALEPFHPLFSSDRSSVVTLAMANGILDRFDSQWLRIAADAYHLWWDPELERELQRASGRIAALHVSDWRLPEGDALRSRSLPGDGVIDLPNFVRSISATGYDGPIEIEVLSDRFRDLEPRSVMRTLHARLQSLLTGSEAASILESDRAAAHR